MGGPSCESVENQYAPCRRTTGQHEPGRVRHTYQGSKRGSGAGRCLAVRLRTSRPGRGSTQETFKSLNIRLSTQGCVNTKHSGGNDTDPLQGRPKHPPACNAPLASYCRNGHLPPPPLHHSGLISILRITRFRTSRHYQGAWRLLELPAVLSPPRRKPLCQIYACIRQSKCPAYLSFDIPISYKLSKIQALITL